MDNIKLIKKIRRTTGLGVITCKKALKKYKGNIKLAINYLLTTHKIKSIDKVQKEGIIKIKVAKKKVVILQISCETDFVSNDINFIRFVNKVANKCLYTNKIASKILFKDKIEIDRTILRTKLKENITVRNLLLINLNEYKTNTIGFYNHNNRIGSLVIINHCILQIAKDIAMQIIATNPTVIYINDFTNEEIKKEKAYIISKIKNKTLNIINKIIKTKIQQYLNENSLLNQVFIKDNTMKVSNCLSHNSKILIFFRFEFK